MQLWRIICKHVASRTIVASIYFLCWSSELVAFNYIWNSRFLRCASTVIPVLSSFVPHGTWCEFNVKSEMEITGRQSGLRKWWVSIHSLARVCVFTCKTETKCASLGYERSSDGLSFTERTSVYVMCVFIRGCACNWRHDCRTFSLLEEEEMEFLMDASESEKTVARRSVASTSKARYRHIFPCSLNVGASTCMYDANLWKRNREAQKVESCFSSGGKEKFQWQKSKRVILGDWDNLIVASFFNYCRSWII